MLTPYHQKEILESACNSIQLGMGEFGSSPRSLMTLSNLLPKSVLTEKLKCVYC